MYNNTHVHMMYMCNYVLIVHKAHVSCIMHLLILLGSEVLQVTSLHAQIVRENELSLVSPDRVTGTPSMTSLGESSRNTTLLMLRV